MRIEKLPFTKVQSLGNDFVLVEMANVHSEQLPELARVTADRHFAVGSDGLLAVGMEGGRLLLRMFNTDGSEDFCGNGIRCAALYGLARGWTGTSAAICHFGQCVHTEVLSEGLVRSRFEPASFAPRLVPVNSETELFFREVVTDQGSVVLSAVTTGSTHAVIFTDSLPGDAEFCRLGPALEHHPLFPQRTSVIWTQVQSSDTLRIRIWERGVGETQGCGTGSAAAAIVYARAAEEGILGSSRLAWPKQICVKNPGGEVIISTTSQESPIITSAVAEILYAAIYSNDI